MVWLKQSTAVDVVIGVFVDDTDGKTVETGLTISQADCQITKNGGAVAQKNDATSASHLGGGHYKVPLNTTDTNTLGWLRLYVNEGGALPVWHDFMVVPANVYNSLVGGSDKLQVHTDEITNGLITAAAIATNAIDADALAADVTTELQNGLATSSALAVVAGYLDTEVAAIKAKTDNLPASPAAVGSAMTLSDGAITDAKFSSAGLNAIADAILKRDWTAVSGEAARSMLNALRFLRNKWAVSAGTLTVYKENDSTSAWTAVVTDDAAADPITGSDPA